MKSKINHLIITLTLLIFACIEVQESTVTIKYSRDNGAGYYEQSFIKISDTDKKGETDLSHDRKGLQELLEHMVNVFTSTGLTRVKSQLKMNKDAKSFDALISGKFQSLAQLPILQSYKFSFADKSEKNEKETRERMDQVIEFSIKSNDMVSTAVKNTFTFVSADPDAQIIDHQPEGTLDKDKRSVTWLLRTDKDKTSTYRVQLKGKSFKSL